ncbi:4-galactosyl-N-acetylglucosaminide 3-alpha-L-fucosyltransferase 9-like isoform X2 [Symsagittifera roscoffensis]|uniref:4-galactosyl-N-acetylglucosaminide 3-alpha-L-fucosyltransferase 9-like isoform X2 n=1 Tax=Symsagittifera roscoffensis TaxID=84072 RepID=UPI00307C1174
MTNCLTFFQTVFLRFHLPKSGKIWIFIILLTCFLSVTIIKSLSQSADISPANITLELIHTKDKKVLLIPKKDYSNGMLDMYFNGNARSTCNLDFNCQFSSSQLLKNAKKLSRYDLIVIGENRGMRTMLQFIREKDYSKWRSKDQLWAYFGVESSQRPTPYLLGAEKEYQNAFNWTVFASPRATIYRPFWYIRESTKETRKQSKQLISGLKSRRKDVCWIFSNCFTDFSRRIEYATEFIRHFGGSFHIWGDAIGDCLSGSTWKKKVKSHGTIDERKEDIYSPQQNKMKDCKFYFAFENSVCEDYVTEKFVNALSGGAIPIVNGWRATYEKNLPGSFIHVSDFSSPASLAKYIEDLSKNKTAMLSYHHWRNQKRIDPAKIESICEMCNRMKTIDNQKAMGIDVKPEVISDPVKTIQRLQTCMTPNRKA